MQDLKLIIFIKFTNLKIMEEVSQLKLLILAQLLLNSIITNNQFALISLVINMNSNTPYYFVVKTEYNYLISHILHSLKFLILNEC